MSKKFYLLRALKMSCQRAKAINCLTVLTAVLSGCLLASCDRHKALTKEELDVIHAKLAADKAHEEARQPRPPIDPALCKDNPEGYLYFKVGNELFRVNKDSPLIIGGVFPELDENDKPIPNDSGIPKGCKDNPLRAGNNGNFVFEKNYKAGRDDPIIEADLNHLTFRVFDAHHQGLVYSGYSMEGFKWENRIDGYKIDKPGQRGEFICQDVAENLTHCNAKSLGINGLNSKFGLYVSNASVYKNIQQLPFVYACNSAIPEVKCSAFYRLYPSVNIEYSIRYTVPNGFNPEKFLPLDKYFRDMYESMRVEK